MYPQPIRSNSVQDPKIILQKIGVIYLGRDPHRGVETQERSRLELKTALVIHGRLVRQGERGSSAPVGSIVQGSSLLFKPRLTSAG